MEDFYGIENIKGSKENTTILLELLKYYGRDVNLVEAFEYFKRINNEEDFNGKNKQQAIKNWYLAALYDLKHMGIISSTKQNIFLFKKNVFGKPKIYKEVQED